MIKLAYMDRIACYYNGRVLKGEDVAVWHHVILSQREKN